MPWSTFKENSTKRWKFWTKFTKNPKKIENLSKFWEKFQQIPKKMRKCKKTFPVQNLHILQISNQVKLAFLPPVTLHENVKIFFSRFPSIYQPKFTFFFCKTRGRGSENDITRANWVNLIRLMILCFVWGWGHGFFEWIFGFWWTNRLRL